MKKWLGLFLVMVLVGSFSAFSEEKTITGEVIDISCYAAAGARGMEHKQCAIDCLKAGEPAGILEETTGKVYIVVTEDHKTSPSEKVLPFVAKMVEVKGNVNERSGISAIDIKEIKEKGKNEMPMKGKDTGMPKEGMTY